MLIDKPTTTKYVFSDFSGPKKTPFSGPLLLDRFLWTFLILFFWIFFRAFSCIQELWIRMGIDDSIRIIPIHLLVETLGSDFCSVLPAVHALAGAANTSKFGTKMAGL